LLPAWLRPSSSPPCSIGTPLRDEQRREQRTLQAAAPFEYRRIVALAFLAAVPRAVVAVPVAVVLAIELVVLVLVADEIAQR
jgi:hypothetical protein